MRHHCASINLSGQPVIQGGMIGLILIGRILVLVLAAIEKMKASWAKMSTAFLLAILS